MYTIPKHANKKYMISPESNNPDNISNNFLIVFMVIIYKLFMMSLILCDILKPTWTGIIFPLGRMDINR